MSIEAIREQLPEYAKDLRLNLGSITNTADLTPQQLWGTMVAVALSCRQRALRDAVVADAQPHLSPEALTAAKGAAAMMAMNNVYYRSTHLMSEQEYGTMRANLRMSFIGRPGIEKADFELFCLAVSAVNGCGACLDSHDKVVREAGLSKAAVHHALRVAAVLHAVACTLDAEAP